MVETQLCLATFPEGQLPHSTKGCWLQSFLCYGICVLCWVQGEFPRRTKKGYGAKEMAQIHALELFPGAGATGTLLTRECIWHPGHFCFQRTLLSLPQLPPRVAGSPVLSTLEWHWLQLCSAGEAEAGQREKPVTSEE